MLPAQITNLPAELLTPIDRAFARVQNKRAQREVVQTIEGMVLNPLHARA